MPRTVKVDGVDVLWTEMARKFLGERATAGGTLRLRRHLGEWWWWDGRRYGRLAEEALEGMVAGWRPDFSGPEVRDVVQCIKPYCLIEDGPMPRWLEEEQGEGLPEPHETIACADCVLGVGKYMRGGALERLPLDARWFSAECLPYSVEEGMECPAWMEFLASSFEEDQDCIGLTQEWFGYCLTSGVQAEKLMVLQGPTRCGKGTWITGLQTVQGGADRVAVFTFRDLAGDFGLRALVGKNVAINPDARVGEKSDMVRALERILSISSGDPQNVRVQFRGSLPTMRLPTKFTIAGNLLLEMPDASGAFKARVVSVRFVRSHEQNPDTTLKGRVAEEAGGIFLWALEGLRRLWANGWRFTGTQATEELKEDLEDAISPVASFMRECLVVAQNAQGEEKEAVWNVYKAWCRYNDSPQFDLKTFSKRMYAVNPIVRSVRAKEGKKRVQKYGAVKIRDEWEKARNDDQWSPDQ